MTRAPATRTTTATATGAETGTDRSLLRTVGPPALLLFCVVNAWWSRTGLCAIELAGIDYRYLDHIWVSKGLYSQHGRLYFMNSCKGGMYAGVLPPNSQKAQVNVKASGFRAWATPPYLGQAHWHPQFVWTDEWEQTTYGGGSSRLGFAAIWQRDGEQFLFIQRGVSVPWWFLVAVFSMTPLRDVLRYWIQRDQSDGAVRCAACGYDLRATPDRCPECGQAAARQPPTRGVLTAAATGARLPTDLDPTTSPRPASRRAVPGLPRSRLHPL